MYQETMIYDEQLKAKVAHAMDVPFESVDLRYAFWAAILAAYNRGDLVGTRLLIERLAD